MRPRSAAITAAVFLALTACDTGTETTETDPTTPASEAPGTTGTTLPRPSVDPDNPATAAAGNDGNVVTIEITHTGPLAEIRGVCWVLERWDPTTGWTDAALVVDDELATSGPLKPSPLDADPPVECPAIGLEGPGPDRIRVPTTSIEPGLHRLCHGTQPGEDTCTLVEVPEPDNTTTGNAATPPSMPVLVAGPVITHPQPANESGAMEALIGGTIVVDGGCLYADGDTERYPIIWPNGTAWNPDTRSVVLPNGTTVPAGEQLRVAGGYITADRLTDSIGTETVERAAACVDNTIGEIAVINNAAGDAQPAAGSRYLATLTFAPDSPLADGHGPCWTVTLPDDTTRDLASSPFPVQASARTLTAPCGDVWIEGSGPTYLRFVTQTDLGDRPEVTACVVDRPDLCVTVTAEWDPA